MKNIIRNGKIAPNNWLPVESVEDALAQFTADRDLLVSLPVWTALREALLARPGRLGLRLEGNDNPEPIAADIQHFGLIAVNFPQFTDGRGYSLALLLRKRYAYLGELRAVGDVPRDCLQSLARCGFNAFSVLGANDEAALNAALASLSDFSEAYQSTVERPLPLFRRRLSANHA
jgi:uncharacterized protein (DUF934 family)